MKLIDANEVKEWIEAFKVGRIAKSELLFALTQMHTIDAEPVKHGRWIEKEDLFVETVYRCSACEEDYVLLDGGAIDDWYNYCPNCGAKMDLEVTP